MSQFAGVAQWQSPSLPSWLCGFDPRHPLSGASSYPWCGPIITSLLGTTFGGMAIDAFAYVALGGYKAHFQRCPAADPPAARAEVGLVLAALVSGPVRGATV